MHQQIYTRNTVSPPSANIKYHIVPIKTAQSLSCLRNNNRAQQCYSLPSSLPQTIFELQSEPEQSFDTINIVNPLIAYPNGRQHSVEMAGNKVEVDEPDFDYSGHLETTTLNDCSNFDAINYADAIDERLIHSR